MSSVFHLACESSDDAIQRDAAEVWKQPTDEFFAEAMIDADGTMVEPRGSAKKAWTSTTRVSGDTIRCSSLWPTPVSRYLSSTAGKSSLPRRRSPVSRSGRRALPPRGFRKIKSPWRYRFHANGALRSLGRGGVTFLFGYRRHAQSAGIRGKPAEKCLATAPRPPKYEVHTQPRHAARTSKKHRRQREFENIRLVKEYIAEFATRRRSAERPIAWWLSGKTCSSARDSAAVRYRAIFFYITNDWKLGGRNRVRCQWPLQPREHHQQHKNGVHALTAPLDNLVSNWAYMVIASLAWSLKAWSALLLPEQGRWKEKHRKKNADCCGWTFPPTVTLG